MTKINEHMQKRMKELNDNNKSLQERKRKSKDELSRNAVDYFTKEIKEHAERNGREMTATQARKHAEELAYRAERKQSK